MTGIRHSDLVKSHGSLSQQQEYDFTCRQWSTGHNDEGGRKLLSTAQEIGTKSTTEQRESVCMTWNSIQFWRQKPVPYDRKRNDPLTKMADGVPPPKSVGTYLAIKTAELRPSPSAQLTAMATHPCDSSPFLAPSPIIQETGIRAFSSRRRDPIPCHPALSSKA